MDILRTCCSLFFTFCCVYVLALELSVNRNVNGEYKLMLTNDSVVCLSIGVGNLYGWIELNVQNEIGMWLSCF